MFKEQQITYNNLNRVATYRLDNNELKFDYRPDTTKWRTRYYEDDVLQYTKYHYGNHEKIDYANGTSKNLFYIFGGKELGGIYIDQNGYGQMGYTITDHLGSIWALVNESGGFIEKYAYDPWGRRVNPDDWSLVDNRNQFITDRGFTLHEHYDQMQIINMVARLYDPLAGVFISVDPLADKYPGWGAYVYCMNNPVEYIDPTGEFVFDPDEFPGLEYLIDDLEEMWNESSDEFKDAFYEFSGMDEEQVKEMFTDGMGPELTISDIPAKIISGVERDVNGTYSLTKELISINDDVFNNAIKYPDVNNRDIGSIDVFQSTVLHEAVHYGRDINDLPNNIPRSERRAFECVGGVFERNAYGKNLGVADSEFQNSMIEQSRTPLQSISFNSSDFNLQNIKLR